MKNQKEKKKTTKIKIITKQTITTTKTPKETHKDKNKIKTKHKKETHPIFPNDFSHVVYLFLHQNLLSTIHLCY